METLSNDQNLSNYNKKGENQHRTSRNETALSISSHAWTSPRGLTVSPVRPRPELWLLCCLQALHPSMAVLRSLGAGSQHPQCPSAGEDSPDAHDLPLVKPVCAI